MTHETFRELLPLYVIGALDGRELAEFEEYVASNRARCDVEIADFQVVADQLALAAPPAQPAPEVFERVLRTIEEPRPARAAAREQAPPSFAMLMIRWLPWAATAVLAVILWNTANQLQTTTVQYGDLEVHSLTQRDEMAKLTKQLGNLNARLEEQKTQYQAQADQLRAQSEQFRAAGELLRARNEEQTHAIEALQTANVRQSAENSELMKATDRLRLDADALRKQLDVQKVQVASLEKTVADQAAQMTQQTARLAHQTEQLELVLDPAIRVAQLADPKNATKAAAKVYWHNVKKTGIVVVSNLVPVIKGEGKALELWAICGKDAPVPAGLFWTDASGHGTLEIKLAKELACIDKFAVTVEPAEGVPAPTGAMVLLGQ